MDAYNSEIDVSEKCSVDSNYNIKASNDITEENHSKHGITEENHSKHGITEENHSKHDITEGNHSKHGFPNGHEITNGHEINEESSSVIESSDSSEEICNNSLNNDTTAEAQDKLTNLDIVEQCYTSDKDNYGREQSHTDTFPRENCHIDILPDSCDIVSCNISKTSVNSQNDEDTGISGTYQSEASDNDAYLKTTEKYEHNNREESFVDKSMQLLDLSNEPTLLDDKLVERECGADKPINSTLNDSISSVVNQRLENLLHDESTSFKVSHRSAAFSTDSRIYNVFTFLDNDDDVYDDDVTDDDVINRTNLASIRYSVPCPVTMATNERDVMNDNALHQSRDADDDNGNGVAETVAVDRLPHPDIEVSDANDATKIERQNSDGSLYTKRKIIPNMELLKNEEFDLAFSGSLISSSSSPMAGRLALDAIHCTDIDSKILDDDDDFDDFDDLDIDVTPETMSGSDFNNDSTLRDTNDNTTAAAAALPEYSAQDEFQDNKDWRIVTISDHTYRIDMKVIDPYKKVLSHGGYYGNGLNAIIVFTACHLPERSVRDYQYIMDNLFLYVISTLELLVMEDYMIIYFHGATSRRKYPGLWWLKRCYDMINRKLKKNLRGLVIVHPTLFLKTLLLMTKPFISSKFTAKMRYVKSLLELTHIVPTEYIFVPSEVIRADRTLNSRTPSPRRKFVNY